jgi:acyl carrier protein
MARNASGGIEARKDSRRARASEKRLRPSIAGSSPNMSPTPTSRKVMRRPRPALAVRRTAPAMTKYTSRSPPSWRSTTWPRRQRVHLHCSEISRSVAVSSPLNSSTFCRPRTADTRTAGFSTLFLRGRAFAMERTIIQRRMDTLSRIKELASREFSLDASSLDPSASLDSLGIDSLAFIEFMFKVEETFGVAVADDQLKSIKTLGDLERQVAAALARAGKA